MGLWQMSYTAGVMILVITAIRAFLVHKLPKKTFMVLWGIVLVRLLRSVYKELHADRETGC